MENIESYEVVLRLLLAAALGAVVGIERERHSEEKERVAGVRTFTLSSILGAASTLLYVFLNSELVMAMAVFGFILLTLMLVWIRNQQGFYGFTTPIAFVLTFFVGSLAGLGKMVESSTLGILTTLLLLGKERIHVVARGLTTSELIGALEFLAIALILVPLIQYFSDYPVIGRGQVLDLYWILIIVVIISSISFVSYIALRTLSPSRSLPMVSVLGGLVSSEATVISLGNFSKTSRGVEAYTSPILLANSSMILRNMVIASISDPNLHVIRRSFIPLILMLALNLSIAIIFLERRGTVEGIGEIKIASPFALKSALSFGGLFAVFNALVYGLNRISGGLTYLISLGGLVSSGAVAASVSSLAYSGNIGASFAADAIILATVISTLNKLLILNFTNPKLVRRSAVGLVPVAALGLICLFCKFAL